MKRLIYLFATLSCVVCEKKYIVNQDKKFYIVEYTTQTQTTVDEISFDLKEFLVNNNSTLDEPVTSVNYSIFYINKSYFTKETKIFQTLLSYDKDFRLNKKNILNDCMNFSIGCYFNFDGNKYEGIFTKYDTKDNPLLIKFEMTLRNGMVFVYENFLFPKSKKKIGRLLFGGYTIYCQNDPNEMFEYIEHKLDSEYVFKKRIIMICVCIIIYMVFLALIVYGFLELIKMKNNKKRDDEKNLIENEYV